MSGKRLLARTGFAAALGMLIFLVLSSVDSQATPIKPDVQKLIRQSQQSHQPFIPARAGWSEPVASASAVRNPVLASMADDHMRGEFRETLATVATPDPWIVLALATLIVLMRKLRSIEAERTRARMVRIPVVQPAVPPKRLAA
jgi:hypothetical protein